MRSSGFAWVSSRSPHWPECWRSRFTGSSAGGAPSQDEFITSAFIDYRAGHWETLTEFAYMYADASDGETFNSNTGYLQVGYRMGDWTPYTRFDYRNMAEGNPFFMPDDRDLDAWEQTFGLRFDFNPYAALKFELSVGEADERDNLGNISSDDTVFFGIQLSWAI